MIPGMGDLMGGGTGEDVAKRMKRVAFIFDSMTTEELDSDGSPFRDAKPSSGAGASGADDFKAREPNKRVLRVARGSGTSVQEVEDLLAQHHGFAMMAKKMGGKNGLMSKLSGARGGAGGGGGPGGALRSGLGGAGMPPLGPGGMPDLSKLSGGQMSALQVGSLSLSLCARFCKRSCAHVCGAFRAQNMLPAGARDMLSNTNAMAQMQQMMSVWVGGQR